MYSTCRTGFVAQLYTLRGRTKNPFHHSDPRCHPRPRSLPLRQGGERQTHPCVRVPLLHDCLPLFHPIMSIHYLSKKIHLVTLCFSFELKGLKRTINMFSYGLFSSPDVCWKCTILFGLGCDMWVCVCLCDMRVCV